MSILYRDLYRGWTLARRGWPWLRREKTHQTAISDFSTLIMVSDDDIGILHTDGLRKIGISSGNFE